MKNKLELKKIMYELKVILLNIKNVFKNQAWLKY